MPYTTPVSPGGSQLPGGIRHQLVLWLNQVGVLQPLLEQLQLRETVSSALEAVPPDLPDPNHWLVPLDPLPS